MVDDVMVELDATDLLRAVSRVLEDTSPFAWEAQLVAGEILRLCDAGQLSQKLARDIGDLIYQRCMHSEHSGDFSVTTAGRELAKEVDAYKREHYLPTRTPGYSRSPELRI